jgi:hypothetical protein
MMGLLALNACKTVTIDDSIWYGSLGSQGAVAEHVLQSGSTVITLEQFAALWDNTSDPLICTNSSVFAAWKSDLEKLCSDSNDCSYDDTQTINAVTQKMGKILKAHKTALKAHQL